jgi:hypothetical protein
VGVEPEAESLAAASRWLEERGYRGPLFESVAEYPGNGWIALAIRFDRDSGRTLAGVAVDGWGSTRGDAVESLLMEVANFDPAATAEFDRPAAAETDI